ncbi:MAG: uncharacterized protein QOE07_2438 [Acidimicrobiaceae bacterium]|jgi:uncharacterized Tic20 family protein|nr:uncharacterized protein [Acidimicrobiaceae bacterium]MDQ1400318.1 uncharacterized protein [Acidimicrobiaceae bacterium]MDQ1413850.1 uncharacterized protein [Acidimicrobiaceae bacterium]
MDQGSSTPYGQDSPPPGSGPPPGYDAPPPPSYPPPGGYGPPPGSGPGSGYGPGSGSGSGYGSGYGGAPGGYNAGAPTPDDKTWAMLCHLSYFVFGLLGPLIVMLTKGKESAFVRDQAVEALNFHITLAIAMFVSAILILVVVGIFLIAAVFIAGAVLAIMASIAAYNGTAYRYPLTLRLVK